MCYCPTPTLHLNLALTGDGAFLLPPQKTHTVWFISILNYGDTENVLINHLLLVIPMSYPCHYTNLCPHKPHKHAHTYTHTHTHTHTPSPVTSASFLSETFSCFCICIVFKEWSASSASTQIWRAQKLWNCWVMFHSQLSELFAQTNYQSFPLGLALWHCSALEMAASLCVWSERRRSRG